MRGLIKQQHPSYALVDVTKELGKRWGVTDAATKARYAAKAEQDRARYERVRMNFCTRLESCKKLIYFLNFRK